MNLSDQVELECRMLPNGGSMKIICPHCDGGLGRETSMSVSRLGGRLAFVCHRATCGARGWSGGTAGLLPTAEKPSRVYTGETLPLSKEDLAWFASKLEGRMHSDAVHRTAYDEYLVPVMKPDFAGWRGVVVRQPWAGSPRTGQPRRPKSDVYIDEGQPHQSVYGHGSTYGRVLLVEDQLSAIKAYMHSPIGYAAALLGTHMDMTKAREIQRLGGHVIIALDADASETALKMAREWAMAWKSCRVVFLDRDLKDTAAKDIPGVLGL